MALIAIGYRGLSMSAAAIGPVKAMVLSLDAGEATAAVEALLALSGHAASLREPLRALGERLGVRL